MRRIKKLKKKVEFQSLYPSTAIVVMTKAKRMSRADYGVH